MGERGTATGRLGVATKPYQLRFAAQPSPAEFGHADADTLRRQAPETRQQPVRCPSHRTVLHRLATENARA